MNHEDIQQHEVDFVGMLLKQLNGLGAVGCHKGGQPQPLQHARRIAADPLLIVHHQHSAAHGSRRRHGRHGRSRRRRGHCGCYFSARRIQRQQHLKRGPGSKLCLKRHGAVMNQRNPLDFHQTEAAPRPLGGKKRRKSPGCNALIHTVTGICHHQSRIGAGLEIGR